ncbi:serine/threonine-protein kinase PknG [Kitasatospora gansuensis]|uniref:non-specific serine/threonine protein kinase n=1 Tax=Kitasatospora gansuensis TaxID=258050 RepID=A0A7W7S9L3_9ACTN|nr:serine/threonine-protein kinase [Kitasatospora gansuensis]MBB4946446.1 serine/threonine-protein kinase PknG [Kitasatospora gansuensis]
MGETCTRPECSGSGTIDGDGYCDECGLAPLAATATASAKAAAVTASASSSVSGSASGSVKVVTGAACTRGCTGTIDTDGYCDECGLAAEAGALPLVPSARTEPYSGSVSSRTMSGRSRSHRSTRTGSGRSVSVRSGTSSSGSGTGRRGNLGAGLVTVPSIPSADPGAAVLTDPQVPERKRFCSKCDAPVGREKNGVPGRPDGFCTKCGTPYSFTPKLTRGDLVGGQYEVLGCLAHGGLGWIYLAVDRRVNDRWVVLKGLLDTGDQDALAVAIAERRFLAEVDHPNIVRIINFVEHPDLRSGSIDGYIVMEYIGGKSLKDIANERRTPDGRREPLPVEQAIAYALEALPALGYLHARGLVYCDFKIDNVIQSEDSLKIIDLGAVSRSGDDGPVYGTVGYQAPEIATDGPSVASDLYTVARTLAVLTFDFQGYNTTFKFELPGPERVPLFARYESYYRLLVRATDPDPARRFGSAEEMADQLTGVLRELLALQDGRPRPALSTLFGPELRVVDTELTPDPLDPSAAALALPVPRVDPADPGAGFLATLVASAPAEALAALATAPAGSVELRLRALRAHLELGAREDAEVQLLALEEDRGDDWRVVWYRGLAELSAGRAEQAAAAFDAVYDAFPGEAAPKLALAVCAELLGNTQDAAEFYRLVGSTDRAYVSAAFGLARVLLAAGDRPGAVTALETVPEASAHYTAARIATLRARLRGRAPEEPLGPELARCSAQLTALSLDARRTEELSVEILNASLGWVLAGSAGGAAGSSAEGVSGTLDVLGHRAAERELRFALEHSYRVLARLTDRAEIRIEMVERANRARPRTWV